MLRYNASDSLFNIGLCWMRRLRRERSTNPKTELTSIKLNFSRAIIMNFLVEVAAGRMWDRRLRHKRDKMAVNMRQTFVSCVIRTCSQLRRNYRWRWTRSALIVCLRGATIVPLDTLKSIKYRNCMSETEIKIIIDQHRLSHWRQTQLCSTSAWWEWILNKKKRIWGKTGIRTCSVPQKKKKKVIIITGTKMSITTYSLLRRSTKHKATTRESSSHRC